MRCLISSSGSQTSSTSSASGPTLPSMRWAMALASAVKKRVSKRRGRRGGVMARAMKWMLRQVGMNRRPRRRPTTAPAGAAGALGAPGAEQQAGLLEGLADGGERQRPRLGRGRPSHVAHQLAPRRADRAARRPASAGRAASTLPPGNTNLPGRKTWPLVAACPAAPWATGRCGRAGSALRRPSAPGWDGRAARRVVKLLQQVGHRPALSAMALSLAASALVPRRAVRARGWARCGGAASRGLRTAARSAARRRPARPRRASP